MGDSLTLLLLGPPDLAVGGLPVGIRSAKARALLCYLAAMPGPRTRAELAALLWGERPDANARGSLRLALTELRREVGGWLDITRDHVRFRAGDGCFVDHRHLTRAPTVAEALRLWRGDFLDGVAFDDAPAFGGWLESERQRVRLLLRELLVRSGPDGSEPVVRLARIVAALDPYDEEAHRLLMASLSAAGNRAAALACYEELRRRLAGDLGVSPAPETLAVRRELAPRPVPARRPTLPVPGTALIGRDDDVRHLRALLSRERLVTLVGPGGVGKTRLAIAAAAPADTAFVSFAGVRQEAAVTTLARRLDVDLSPQRPALELLLAALAGRTSPLLLVLDNLEHLPEFDPVIGRILRTAPAVRVLATSRRRLDLPGQVTVTVDGLAGPDAEALFTARAAKACPGFDPHREAALVAAICAATGGLPLAIELAAGLLRAVPCADLARRLEVDLALLSVAGPAARSRHACMRTVFETSWQLLDPAGQRALAALSVFGGGGCTLDAALEVATTSLDVLVRLVDHSVIHLTPSGRYTVHPLIQQYAAAHLTPGERDAARLRHAAHFTRLLDRHAGALQDASDAGVTGVLGVEMDNIRLAWATSGRAGLLAHYWTLCLRLHLYEESGAIVRGHLAHATEPPWLRARHLWMAGTSEHQLAREREATDLARAALRTLGRPLPESRAGLLTATLTAAARQALHRLFPWPTRLRPSRPAGTREAVGREAAQALTMLARLAYHQQDLPTMLAASFRQLNAAERTSDPALRAEAYANAATIARVAGRHRLAGHYGRLADRALANLEHAAEAANRARLARGLDQLHSGAFEAARRSFAEGRARTLAPRVAENCAGMLAETALWRGDFATAADLFASTAELAARRVGGDDIGRHWCLMGQVEAMLRIDGLPPDRIAPVLAGARASTERRRTHEKELGLRDGPIMPTIGEMRLRTATARLTEDPQARQAAFTAVLGLAGRLPPAQRGMLECWAGLAELLWSLDPWPDRATARLLLTHLSGYLARNPGAAARIGWARALVLAVAGDDRPARKAAERAMAAADRLAAPYDHGRAEEIARHLAAASGR